MKTDIFKIKKHKINKKIKMPGVRFGPPPKKGPASQGMRMGGYICRQNKNK